MNDKKVWVHGTMVLLALSAACSDDKVPLTPLGGIGASCQTLDEASCGAADDCYASYCPGCGGATYFVGCTDDDVATVQGCPEVSCPTTNCGAQTETACGVGENCEKQLCLGCDGEPYYLGCKEAGTLLGCPDLVCPPAECEELDESACQLSADCEAHYCPDCAGASYFVGCQDSGTVTTCPFILCPPHTCDRLTNLECRQSPNCHARYEPLGPVMCGCAEPGCCTYEGCFPGRPSCGPEPGQPVCDALAPNCDAGQVPTWSGGCFDGGCVFPEDCAE